MFKAWEAFQEDCVLAFMKGEARIDGKIIKSYVRKLRYEAPARKLLLQGKLYIEWTKPKDVIRRVDIFFPNAALITDPLGDFESALTEIYDVRNAIAHSSAHSLAQLKKIADNVKGASKNPKRAFDCLVIEPKDNSKDYFRKLPSYGFIEKNRMTFFDVYEEVLFVLAKQILGGFPP